MAGRWAPGRVWLNLNKHLKHRCCVQASVRFNHAASQKLKWSYVHGQSSVPLMGVTIGQRLQHQVELNPDREAVVFCEDKVRKTLGQLLDEADQFAAGLLQLGLKRGDRVGIWGPNSLEWVLTQYATARAGIIMVNINPSYKEKELENALTKVGCKGLVSAPGFKNEDYYKLLSNIIPELETASPGGLKSQRLKEFKFLIMMGEEKYKGAFNFSEVMAGGTSKDRATILDLQNQLQFDDPINIQFTSKVCEIDDVIIWMTPLITGTTGFPKGVTLSHHTILNNSYFVGLRLGYDKETHRICCPVPLYHCFGMVLACLQIPSHGACCIFPSTYFDPRATLQAVQDEKATALYGVPTMFVDMLNHPDFSQFNYSSLSTGIMAGSPCPISIMKKVNDLLHMPEVTVCYGMTETGPVTMQSLTLSPMEKRVSTVGKCADHTEGKVVGKHGELLPVNTPGELCTRGYTSMLGYWEDRERTAEVITSDRWLHTGDIATIDEDGYCKIVGRTKDMVIRGGENIFPTEIEDLIHKHPKVKDVQVVGVPDERLGEQLCVWIILKDDEILTEQDVKDYCKDKVARFKVPRYVQFVCEFPLTVTGKVQKFKIREEAMKQLGLNELF